MILGAGGAARALSVELAKRGAGHITIVNRSRKRGEELTEHLKSVIGASACDETWERSYTVPAGTDMLINATSIGLYPDLNIPDIDYDTLTDRVIVCDIIPNPLHTKFLARAQECGCRTFDGFSMLVNQAAVSFKLWTGLNAPIEVMLEALKSTSV
ncbi:MAG: hypothetical protein LUD73_01885 [Lachnospiraceae bacterium]|nr:hypothetical protein [Lachnospiraceae bacterium]